MDNAGESVVRLVLSNDQKKGKAYRPGRVRLVTLYDLKLKERGDVGSNELTPCLVTYELRMQGVHVDQSREKDCQGTGGKLGRSGRVAESVLRLWLEKSADSLQRGLRISGEEFVDLRVTARSRMRLYGESAEERKSRISQARRNFGQQRSIRRAAASLK